MSVAENKSLISELHSKYAEKAWNETFQLVRRCMMFSECCTLRVFLPESNSLFAYASLANKAHSEVKPDKSRGDSKPCEPLIRCLKRLHEALNVSSLSAMVSRLEMVAKQRGMGSHLSHTGTTCYLTADMFYLEVILLSGGQVEDVKVAQHGENLTSSESLLQLLRSKKFGEFSLKLEDLFSLYNIPGDNETKIKVYTALQFLGKDLQKISHLPRLLREHNVQVDMILNGRVGYLTGGKEGTPSTMEYYISPSDILLESSDSERYRVGQMALVTVEPTDTPYKLQMSSLITQPPQIDVNGLPLFIPLCDVSSEMVSACFQLKLQPPIPMFRSFFKRLGEITADADQQWAPFPQLLRMLFGEEGDNQAWDGQDASFLVPLPGRELHSYVFSGDAWSQADLNGALVCTIPFTHPAHVPPLLELLRHQCAINTLLSSCITSHRPSPDLVCELHCEVLPESNLSISLSFHQPHSDSLSVLLVNVSDSRQLTCSLFEVGSEDLSTNEYISKVLKRCMSIPVTMRALMGMLPKRTGGVPLPACSFTVSSGDQNPASLSMFIESDHNAASGPGSETDSVPTTQSAPSVCSQGAMEQNATPMEPESAYCMSVTTSQSVTEVNTKPLTNPYLCVSVGVYSHWMANNPEIL